MPEDQIEDDSLEKQKEKYYEALKKEIQERAEQYSDESIKTIYIGGGTPFELGPERLERLIDVLMDSWETEHLEELTIELNPDPPKKVLAFIENLTKKYKKLYKLRFSIGIQTFDDAILKESKRQYSFLEVQDFLRKLQKLKQPNISFNGDFIAFGKFTTQEDGTKTLWDEEKRKFFYNFVNSGMFDGFSLYTLELYPGSNWYNEALHTAQAMQKIYGEDEYIMQEFEYLKGIIEDAGYRRYELSNFAKHGQESIHNMVYWQGWSYLGLGINASSYLNQKTIQDYGLPQGVTEIEEFKNEESRPVRFKNTHKWKEYLAGNVIDQENWEIIDEKEQLWEGALFALRTQRPLPIDEYQAILEDNAREIIDRLVENGLALYDDEADVMQLTPEGMKIYNSVVTDLFTLA